MKRSLPAVIALAVLIGIAAGGLWLWASASDGQKTSDLGSALVGGAVIGVGLIAFERAWDRSQAARASAQARATVSGNAAPTIDSPTELSLSVAEVLGVPEVD